MAIYCDQRKLRRSSCAAVRQRFSVPLCSPGCSCPLAACPLHFRRPESHECSYSAESFEMCVESERVKEGRFCFQLYRKPCFYISPYNLKAWRHVFGDSELFIYLPHDLFIFLFVNLTDFLSFLQNFFLVEFCFEAKRRLKVFPPKLV